MAPKKQTQTTEEILLDIKQTLIEGFAALAQVIVAGKADPGEVPASAPPAAPEGDPDDKDVPKFLREHMEKHPNTTTEELIRTYKVSINKALAAVKQFGKKAETKKPAEKTEKPGPVTVEALRKMISDFAEKFGMNEALRINEQFGGSRKVSGIPEEKYEAVFNAMADKMKAGEEEVKGVAEEITKEDIQKAGAKFIEKYGDPAFRELLAKYVAKGAESKISQVPTEKYAALHEALINA